MAKKLLLKDAKLIDPLRKINKKGSILIEDGKISTVGEINKKRALGAEEINLRNKIVIPGCIDLHTHLREPGQEEKETIYSGARAAAAGGFTAVCAMPNTNPAIDSPEIVKFIYDKAFKDSCVDIFVIGAITKGRKGQNLTEFGKMKESGVVALSDDGNGIKDAGVMRQALEYSKAFNVPLFIHAEDDSLSHGGAMNEGYYSTKLGISPMPKSSEEIVILRDINLLEEYGGEIHFCHISSKKSKDYINEAKKRKLKVTCEATPHHFTLTDKAVSAYDTNTKVNPPLREEEDVKAIIQGLGDETIDAIATDHAPHTIEDKNVEYGIAAFGISGLETAIPLAMKLVNEKKISIETLVYKLSINPAKILGLKDRGSLKEGLNANLTIIDPTKEYIINKNNFYSKGKNTPFNGWKLQGCSVMTIVNGQVVYPFA